MVSNASAPVWVGCAQLVGLYRWVEVDLGYSWAHICEHALNVSAAADSGVQEVVAKYNSLFGREPAIWKSNLSLSRCSTHSKRERKLCGHLKINIEELWSKLYGTHMGVEMAYIESPVDSAFDLCATFFANFIKIGMIPEVGKGSRESAVAV
jgi:hypothetical protein